MGNTISIPAITVIILLLFSLPARALAQSTLDLAVHYVDGAPVENEIAYEVDVYLSVVDEAGDPIKDLPAESLIVTEDSQEVEITSLEIAPDEPIHIVLVMDTSGSMSGTGISAAKAAASNFVSQLESDDRIAVVTFDDVVNQRLEFSGDHGQVIDLITSIEVVRGAGTCMYDAAYEAVQMGATLPAGRRAVILFTDGVDETPSGRVCSLHTIDDVLDLASTGGTRTPIYALGLGNRIDTNTLRRIAERTGGRYLFSADPSQVESAFERLSEQLRSQYLLKYRSTAGPGAHTLAVNANHNNAEDSDTRNFLLPALPTRLTFITPLDGEEVAGDTKLAVSLSGSGEVVKQVAFEIEDIVIGTDESTPFEVEVDLENYPDGEMSIEAIAYGSDNSELARGSVTVNRTSANAPPATTAPPEPSGTIEANVNRTLIIVGGGLGGLGLVIIVLLITMIRRQRKPEKEKDHLPTGSVLHEPLSMRSDMDASQVTWVVGRSEPIPEAFGVLAVEASDDPSLIGHRFEITASITTLGRSADCDINFPKDSPVSRRHAEIHESKGRLRISEVESIDTGGGAKSPKFGTFVNEVPVGIDGTELKTGDQIRLGKRVVLKFESYHKSGSLDSLTYDEMTSSEDPDATQAQF